MRKLLLIVLVLIIPVFVYGQESDVLRLGFKLGPNMFFGSGDSTNPDITGSRTTVGFTGGGFAEWVPIDYLSVELGIMLSWFNYGVETNVTQSTVTLQYTAMEFPLIVKGRLPLGPGSLFLGIGPDFILILGQVNMKFDQTIVPKSPDQVFHVGLMASAGYDWEFAKHSNLTFELRYLAVFTSPDSTYGVNANRFDFLIGWSADF